MRCEYESINHGRCGMEADWLLLDCEKKLTKDGTIIAYCNSHAVPASTFIPAHFSVKFHWIGETTHEPGRFRTQVDTAASAS